MSNRTLGENNSAPSICHVLVECDRRVSIRTLDVWRLRRLGVAGSKTERRGYSVPSRAFRGARDLTHFETTDLRFDHVLPVLAGQMSQHCQYYLADHFLVGQLQGGRRHLRRKQPSRTILE